MKTTRHILMAMALTCAGALAQQPQAAPGAPGADPFTPREGVAPVEEASPQGMNGPRQISVLFEAFSLECADAAAFMRAGLDGKALYDKILEKTAKKEATQEVGMVVRARSGERGLLQSVSEEIYPTEYEPPALPCGGMTSGNAEPTTRSTPATPTSFETRNTGWTLEVEPTLATEGKLIDLRLAPSFTAKAGTTTAGQGQSLTEMPLFDSQRIDSGLIVRSNVPFLVGTLNRPPASLIDPPTAKKIWFAFVTCTVVTPAGSTPEP